MHFSGLIEAFDLYSKPFLEDLNIIDPGFSVELARKDIIHISEHIDRTMDMDLFKVFQFPWLDFEAFRGQVKSVKLLLVELCENRIMIFQCSNNFAISVGPFVADSASFSDTFFENHDSFTIAFTEIHPIGVICIVYYPIFNSFMIFAVVIKVAE